VGQRCGGDRLAGVSGDSQPIGQILDGLGVRQELEDGDLVTDALVLTKLIDPAGVVQLGVSHSDGISWIERLGLLHAALQLESQNGIRPADE
jgi:hypothetical protein